MIVDPEGDTQHSGSHLAVHVVVLAFALGGVGGYMIGTLAPIERHGSTGRLVDIFGRSTAAESSGAAAADRGDWPVTPYAPELDETNRRIATCDTPFNDQPEYCSGTAPWASSHPAGVTPESFDGR